MIQIILNWDGDWETIKSPYYAKVTINEMKDNTYLVLLNEPDDFDDLEQEMESQEDVFIVGSYNMDGTQYIYGNRNRNHSINKYKGKLRNKITYNDEGNIIEDVPYTEAEALEKQVNKIAGTPDRVLE